MLPKPFIAFMLLSAIVFLILNLLELKNTTDTINYTLDKTKPTVTLEQVDNVTTITRARYSLIFNGLFIASLISMFKE